jgi:hypothetical protein
MYYKVVDKEQRVQGWTKSSKLLMASEPSITNSIYAPAKEALEPTYLLYLWWLISTLNDQIIQHFMSVCTCH